MYIYNVYNYPLVLLVLCSVALLWEGRVETWSGAREDSGNTQCVFSVDFVSSHRLVECRVFEGGLCTAGVFEDWLGVGGGALFLPMKQRQECDFRV